MANEVKAIYGCAQKDLYSGIRLLCKHYADDQGDFHSYKAKYTLTWGTDLEQAVKDAEALPDSVSLDAIAEAMRPDLLLKSEDIIDDFKKTMGYIDELYTNTDERRAQYLIAGYNYFVGAEAHDWESVKQLGVKNVAYVTGNATALEMGGINMPTGFPADALTHSNAFGTQYLSYLNARGTGTSTSAKITANNAITITSRGLMRDASLGVYPRNATMKDRYIWDSIMVMINPEVAGMDGYVQDAVSSVMIEGAEVSMKMAGSPAILTKTDANGRYGITGITAGEYTYTITMAGYKTITGTITVKLRTVSRRNFNMVMV